MGSSPEELLIFDKVASDNASNGSLIWDCSFGQAHCLEKKYTCMPTNLIM